jgi:hypothetical protein
VSQDPLDLLCHATLTRKLDCRLKCSLLHAFTYQPAVQRPAAQRLTVYQLIRAALTTVTTQQPFRAAEANQQSPKLQFFRLSNFQLLLLKRVANSLPCGLIPAAQSPMARRPAAQCSVTNALRLDLCGSTPSCSLPCGSARCGSAPYGSNRL